MSDCHTVEGEEKESKFIYQSYPPNLSSKWMPNDPEFQHIVQLTSKLQNPLAELTLDELTEQAKEFCFKNNLTHEVDTFIRGAILAADPKNLDRIPGITQEERKYIEQETTHRWRQPFMMYFVAAISSIAAIIQGMDESIVNGAQIFYNHRFGIEDDPQNKNYKKQLIQGLINGSSYLCCAVFACWINDPMNRLLGRRGVLFWSCLIAGATSIWEGFTYTWLQFFTARFAMGIGIGPKSATAPIYTAECSPASIRGALVMQWQMWTAFGIALGDVASVVLMGLPENVAWRMMLGSCAILPVVVCCLIYYAPESPRWYMSKDRVAEAYQSMRKLRFCSLQASRDLFYMAKLLEIEKKTIESRNLFTDMWRVPRVRRAAQASGLVMLMQQLCGVNVVAYYSSEIFIEAGIEKKAALLTTMGTGIVNWVFAIPAMYTIDTFGRRNLLLATFPLLAACLFATGFAFDLPDPQGTGNTNDPLQHGKTDHRRVGLVAAAIYLYMIFYSPGGGPVPFTYSAEAFPLYIRDFGMSFATAVCWFFNFLLAITFPIMSATMKPQGAFGWYAGWCMIGWVAILFTLPETKELTLEELDYVFSIPTAKHASYQLKKLIYYFKRYILRQKVQPPPALYQIESSSIS